MLGRLIAPLTVALGLSLALGLGFATSLHPAVGLAIATAACVGIAAFVLPAGWFATTSLIFVTVCAVLVPVLVLENVEIVSLTPRPLLALAFVAAAGLTLMRHGPGLLFRGGRTAMFAAVWVLGILTVSLFNVSPNLSIMLSHWALWASAFILALAVPPRLVRIVLISWIVLAFFEAAYAVYETLFDPGLFFGEGYTKLLYRWIDYTVENFVRARSTLGHHIALAMFLVTSFALALWAVRFPARKRLAILRVAILAVIVLGAVATFSRSGWTTLGLVAVAGLVLYHGKKINRMSIIVLCGALAVLSFYVLLASEAIEFAQRTSGTISFTQRASSVQSVPGLLSTRPLQALVGVGANAQVEMYNWGLLRYVRPDTPVIDNMYVTIVLQSGLLGLGLFIAMLWSAFRAARERVSVVSSVSPISPRTISGMGIAVCALLTMFFFIDGLYWPATAGIFWALLGFIVRRDERVPYPDRTFRRDLDVRGHAYPLSGRDE